MGALRALLLPLLLLLVLLLLVLLLPMLPLLLRRLAVEQDALNVHAQLGHFLKPLGGDEVLLVAFGRVFHEPLQLLRSFDKNATDSKGIHGSETVLVLGLGCHWSPLIEDGKISALLSLESRTCRLNRLCRANGRRSPCTLKRRPLPCYRSQTRVASSLCSLACRGRGQNTNALCPGRPPSRRPQPAPCAPGKLRRAYSRRCTRG